MAKKKKIQNKFDALVEKLAKEFIKIPNFDLMTTDEVGNKVFNVIAFRLADIASYKDLVCQHFIPATNKAIFDTVQDYKKSTYKQFLNPDEVDFKETLHDTIRLAYVGLFHKLENYINDLVKLPELIFSNVNQSEITVAAWSKKQYGIDFKDWQMFLISFKINWICNCVKHKDGFPIKEPKPLGYRYADESRRIVISPEEFKKDCEQLIQFYVIYLQTILAFAQHKMVSEMSFEGDPESESYRQYLDRKNELDEIMSKYAASIKDMRPSV